MSSFFRSELFDWIIGAVELSNDMIFNWVFASMLYVILTLVTYGMVGYLYKEGFINGKLVGKIFYFFIFILNVIITAGVLWIIRGIIWLYKYIQSLSFITWIFVCIALLIMLLIVTVSKKQ